MCACHAEGFEGAREPAQHLRALFRFKAVPAEVCQLGVCVGHGGGVNHQRSGSVKAGSGDEARVFLVVYRGSFALQSACQFRRRPVITRHIDAFGKKVTGQSAHPDAPYAHKVCRFYIIQFHVSFFYHLLPLQPGGTPRRQCALPRRETPASLCSCPMTRAARCRPTYEE